MTKQTASTARTRQNLMQAFWQLYCQKRIENITVREITAKAGYNRGTFYAYFTDVYHLLEELENSLIPTLHQLPHITSRPPGEIGMLFDFYEQNSQYYSVLLDEKGDPAFAAKLKISIKPLLQGLMPKEMQNTLQADYALEYILSAMVGVMSHWYSCGQNLPREELVHLIQNLSENGVTSCLAP